MSLKTLRPDPEERAALTEFFRTTRLSWIILPASAKHFVVRRLGKDDDIKRFLKFIGHKVVETGEGRPTWFHIEDLGDALMTNAARGDLTDRIGANGWGYAIFAPVPHDDAIDDRRDA
ncbi:hypothetical protein D869_gp110 [Caulobacter phage CcrRogue]|uniref:Uncharacterized protein n=1 Tax=Caulobacter phage CcrRogue TaxID=2927986 RepID=K4JNK1_9CAUD|nr:hypothetical protein D869_gp110 [Caulobacter phage CcrRogue]AFU86804.1 hypothetical protein CcrRogue_gp322 [Caulobacter phage CcrRogue]